MAYQRPMVTVDQNMTITPTSIERDQPAFVFGPNYELHRYEDPGEKEKTLAEKRYEGYGTEFPYPNAIDGESVDQEYTKLFGDNVVVAIADAMSAAYEPGEFNTGFKKIQCGKLKFADSADAELKKKLKAGSVVQISVGDGSGGGGSGDSGSDDGSGHVTLTKVIGYVRPEDHSTLNETGVYIQDQIEGGAQTVDVTIVDVVDGVEFCRKNIDYTSAEDKWQWEQGEITDSKGDTCMGVKVNKLFAHLRYDWDTDVGRMYEVLSADLYVTYRELVTSFADTIHSLTGASEVANVLGAVSPDNPLAMGVYMAALNSATDDGDEAPPVYFMAVSLDEDGKLDYAEVLNRASLTDRVYVLAPTTRDEEVLEMVRSHVEAMSVKTVKQWRIAAVSAYVPPTVSRLNAKMDPQGNDFYAVVLPNNVIKVVKGSGSTEGNPDTEFRSTVVAGDIVKLDQKTNVWGEKVWDTFTVKRVINNYMLEVKEDVTEEANGPIEIDHEYTASETAEVVASMSRAMASRRMLNVFPSVFGNDGVTLTGEFAACAVAGLVSATEPQQPITNVTVRGIDDIPMVYQTYSKADLDLMASGGTFIVCQDLPGDIVYVRHQITTAYPDGNLNTAELSITKNVDNISYAFAGAFRPYYGKSNITPDLLAILRNVASTLIDQFAGSTSTYGPQLIAEETEILFIRQNELMKDHVDIGIRLGVPYPCNNIDIVLTV